MINDNLITTELDQIFAGYPKTDDLLDFYNEVKADVQESAQDLLDNGEAATPEAAVHAAVTGLGDLSEPLQLVSETSDQAITETYQTGAVVDQTFAANQIQHIILTVEDSRVRFIPSADNQIHLRQYQQPKLASSQLQIHQLQDTLQATASAPSWLHYLIPFRHPTSQIELALPLDFSGSIELRLKSGALTMTDLQVNADCTLSLTSGTVTITQANLHSLNTQLTSGSFKADHLTADQLKVNATSGVIRLNNTTANFNINAHSGSIKGSSLTGHGSFSAHSGSIKLDWLTVDGDLKLDAHSGTIKTQQPQQDQFKFNLQSNSGTVKVDRSANFDVQVQGAAIGQAGADPSYTLTGTAHSGTIKLQ